MRSGRPRARAVVLVAALMGGLLTVGAMAGPAGAATRYEAENATISQGAVATNHLNYSGTGFVDGTNIAGSYLEWSFDAPAAGTATLVLRYANGTTTTRTSDVSVNGAVVSAGRAFPGTGNWDTWANSTLTAPVTAGANKIRVTATGADGNANLDYLDVTVAAPSNDYQAEDATLSQAGVFSNHLGYTGTGFVDYTNVTGSYVQFTVNAASAGPASLTFRYANGTTVARPMTIAVNGVDVAADLVFPGTGNWDTWADLAVNATLNAGSNTVRATATTANGGPNLDRLSVGTPSDTERPTTPGQPSCSGVGENGLTLNWGASTDNVGVVAYDIYNYGNKISEAGNVTSKQLTGLTPNTTYSLTVFARDAAGNVSPPSPIVECTTSQSSDTQKPSTPGTLTSSNLTSNSVQLSWGASTDNVGVVAYEVRSGTTVYATVTGNPPATSATVSGLACNSPYSLTVVAKDAAGNVSDPSNTVTFTTPSCNDPDGGVPSSITQISSGWTIPWGMAWLPDGQTALVTERDDKVASGQFRVYKVTLAGTKTLVGTVPNASTTGTTSGEGGLMGAAVDPNWTTNHFVYFFHTSPTDNRIVRMTYNGTSLSSTSTPIVTGIRRSLFHNGGRLAFGPDGYLYATTGDSQQGNLAQDRNSLNGKILRMTTTGQPAPGNPFGTLVYSYGHRNPQGIAWDSQGRLWEAEFGNSAVDELNLIKPGLNYGWPTCEGTCSVSGMTNPKKTWSTGTASPSAIAIVRNVVYMAALKGERLWRIPIGSGESVGTATAYYVGAYGRLRTVIKVPGANQLWLSTTNCDNNGDASPGSDRIFRVTIT
ncbi:PQQ-dependent sugar dehydrogenase [Planotetraspora sp. A-T 1434]|uniref:PQQ-dependent sugar dehydrogenase n=1 Tax=Planotetraspora sp. A-T 1434 TaxID=2979219 RepID=UPI0021BF31C1|nr:PQQ-dependent sugar dehydrogenase [Planotetraspora sp. A-T 1434]MCT9930261.1 PQQ-dependent sugar dehydrogenase [Planotetraspora sp. A-T 1434]